jgi:hypothetical protein
MSFLGRFFTNPVFARTSNHDILEKEGDWGGMAKQAWGGPWTIQKLDAFEKYVRAYLTI